MRVRDWQSRVAACIELRAAEPLVWGRHDCASFAADVVQAATGHDRLQGLRGTYGSALEAARLIEQLGGLQVAVSARLGPAIAPPLATLADVGLSRGEDGHEALAVCAGGHWIAPSAHGLVTLQPGSIVAAWRCEGVADG